MFTIKFFLKHIYIRNHDHVLECRPTVDLVLRSSYGIALAELPRSTFLSIIEEFASKTTTLALNKI